MRSLIILALFAGAVSAATQTMVFVSSDNSPYKVLCTWDPALVPDSKLVPLFQAYFYAYPKMVAKYNPNALKNLTWIFDPSYNGVAATSAGVTRFSTTYFGARSDAGAAVHETMHVVQAYPSFAASAGWLTEGIADYVRDEFSHSGYNYNADSNWSLPPYSSGQTYTQGYGVTASFLKYLETKYPGIVVKLDSAMRTKAYTANTWSAITGKTVDQLWSQYASASSSGKRRRRSVEAGNEHEVRVIKLHVVPEKENLVETVTVPATKMVTMPATVPATKMVTIHVTDPVEERLVESRIIEAVTEAVTEHETEPTTKHAKKRVAKNKHGKRGHGKHKHKKAEDGWSTESA